MQSAFHVDLADAVNYDLTINTAVLEVDGALDRKAQRLDLPASALGPGAGLGAYPGGVEDLQAPAASQR